jgi:hypothetical protein
MLVLKRLKLYQKPLYIAFTLAVAVILLSSGVYFALNPPTYQVSEETDKTVYNSSYTHHSETATQSSLYDKGQTVTEPDRYFTELHTTLQFEHTIQENGNSVSPETTEYKAFIRASSSRGDELFVEKPISIDDRIVYTSENGFRVDIPEFNTALNDISEELPRNSQVKVKITGQSTLEQTTLSDTIYIQFVDDRTYSVTTETDTEEITQTEAITKPQPSQTIYIAGVYLYTTGILISLFGLSAFIIGDILLAGYFTTEKGYETLEYEYQKEKFSKWITTGQPFQDPSLKGSGQLIEVDRLKGLVDIAIDNSSRVVQSEGLGRFYVYTDHAIYVYTAPNSQMKDFFISSSEAVPSPDSKSS